MFIVNWCETKPEMSDVPLSAGEMRKLTNQSIETLLKYQSDYARLATLLEVEKEKSKVLAQQLGEKCEENQVLRADLQKSNLKVEQLEKDKSAAARPQVSIPTKKKPFHLPINRTISEKDRADRWVKVIAEKGYFACPACRMVRRCNRAITQHRKKFCKEQKDRKHLQLKGVKAIYIVKLSKLRQYGILVRHESGNEEVKRNMPIPMEFWQEFKDDFSHFSQGYKPGSKVNLNRMKRNRLEIESSDDSD